jgi:Pilus biogenesis CpaD protein (pilus_cpaD)
MSKVSFSQMFRPASLIMAVLSASVLSGCVAQDLALDDGFVPYTVDDRYPLVAVNGKAVRKPCGKWPTNLADTSNNQRFTNHGCAIRANMAAMIANPDDIVEPHPLALSPAPSRVQAVNRINNGQTAGTNRRSFFSIF